MNCPFHILIYEPRSARYRDLPLRLFELGTVYRYERSGALHGLMRVRGFTQDDAHIFCTPEQVARRDRVAARLRALASCAPSASTTSRLKLSTKTREKSVGADEMLGDGHRRRCAQALERHGLDYEVDEGGGAFYGPKIDVDVRDAIGRSWQLSTIQLDFNLPERFDLDYVGADDASAHRPVMIHRALFGSIERFFGVLVEHYAGAFPAWLAPVQARGAAGGGRRTRPTPSRSAADCAGRAPRRRQRRADESLGNRIRKAKSREVTVRARGRR